MEPGRPKAAARIKCATTTPASTNAPKALNNVTEVTLRHAPEDCGRTALTAPVITAAMMANANVTHTQRVAAAAAAKFASQTIHGNTKAVVITRSAVMATAWKCVPLAIAGVLVIQYSTVKVASGDPIKSAPPASL